MLYSHTAYRGSGVQGKHPHYLFIKKNPNGPQSNLWSFFIMLKSKYLSRKLLTIPAAPRVIKHVRIIKVK